MRTHSEDGRTVQGQHYRIAFDHEPPLTPSASRSPFGIRYTFDLVDAIDACPEYLIPMSVFRSYVGAPFMSNTCCRLCRMCEQVGLELVQELPFPSFYEHYSRVREHEGLLRRMGVVDAHSGAMCLDDGERSVAALYTTFVFRKKADLRNAGQ